MDGLSVQGRIFVMSMFELGMTVVTRGVGDLMSANRSFAQFVGASLVRYANGNWGDLCDEDKLRNEIALREGERLLGAYEHGDWKIWIITEWDRSVTTILFPDEY